MKIMQIRIFSLGASCDAEQQEDMNKFLRGHRIIEVRQQYDETRGIWTFAVSYVEGSNPPSGNFQPRADKVDYRSVLAPDVFEVFSRLREQRKLIAKDESVPAYAIFTDKELAAIAELPELSVANLVKIDGINKGRAEKYGVRLMQLNHNVVADEA